MRTFTKNLKHIFICLFFILGLGDTYCQNFREFKNDSETSMWCVYDNSKKINIVNKEFLKSIGFRSLDFHQGLFYYELDEIYLCKSLNKKNNGKIKLEFNEKNLVKKEINDSLSINILIDNLKKLRMIESNFVSLKNLVFKQFSFAY